MDYQYCSGCHACEVACKKEHDLPKGDFGIKVLVDGPRRCSDGVWEFDNIPVPTHLCDLCEARVAAGKLPTCVHHCQAGVMAVSYTHLESRPHSFVLAYHDGAALPAWHARHAERCAIVRRQDTFSYFLNTMQGLFMRFMVWENELDRVVMRKGTLQELLDADERFTGHDVVVRDAFGTVLAASPSHAGGPTASEEDEGHADASHAGRPTASPASHLVAAPILVSQTAFATIELACTGAASQGCADMLALLARRAGAICERLWKDQVRVVCPHYFFFAGLIEGTSPQDGSRARRLREMGVPSPAQFKLIAFDLDGHDASLLVEPVMQAASRLNGGACFCLPYHGKVLALCYAEEGDKQLSHKASQRDVARLLHEPFGPEGCASQIQSLIHI